MSGYEALPPCGAFVSPVRNFSQALIPVATPKYWVRPTWFQAAARFCRIVLNGHPQLTLLLNTNTTNRHHELRLFRRTLQILYTVLA
mmetsp:Transcript_28843/g.67950  ORF Transcript_28843/g.67950 Transcript_28843/m.67950 type:complete len:87 (-) Transcript_28843:1978-2238(-)